MKFIAAMFLSWMFLSTAVAQTITCPPGYYPIGGQDAQGCAPHQEPVDTTTHIPEPEIRWEDRWGALAVDSAEGAFGGAEGHLSKQKAEQAAITQCQERGGKACRVHASTHNQCRALAWGDQKLISATESTVDQAKRGALDDCSAATTDCRLYYSGCSYPARVQ